MRVKLEKCLIEKNLSKVSFHLLWLGRWNQLSNDIHRGTEHGKYLDGYRNEYENTPCCIPGVSFRTRSVEKELARRNGNVTHRNWHYSRCDTLLCDIAACNNDSRTSASAHSFACIHAACPVTLNKNRNYRITIKWLLTSSLTWVILSFKTVSTWHTRPKSAANIFHLNGTLKGLFK